MPPETPPSPLAALKLFLCLPHYGQREDEQAEGMLRLQADLMRGGAQAHFATPVGSLLALNHNLGWAAMLNLRDRGQVTHLLNWHADVVPITRDWLAVLLAEMARTGAQVLSVVNAIKATEGLTSTARDTDRWRPVRYTVREVCALPEATWTARDPDLLVNTGLLLVDVRGAWVEEVCFTIQDRIIRDPETGAWRPDCEPEDWNFSRQCWRLGVPVYATRAVATRHLGKAPFPNDVPWGSLETDEPNISWAQRRVVAAHLAAQPEGD